MRFKLTLASPLYACMVQRFSAVIMRLRDPKTTALIFGSGKVRPRVCVNVVYWVYCAIALTIV